MGCFQFRQQSRSTGKWFSAAPGQLGSVHASASPCASSRRLCAHPQLTCPPGPFGTHRAPTPWGCQAHHTSSALSECFLPTHLQSNCLLKSGSCISLTPQCSLQTFPPILAWSKSSPTLCLLFSCRAPSLPPTAALLWPHHPSVQGAIPLVPLPWGSSAASLLMDFSPTPRHHHSCTPSHGSPGPSASKTIHVQIPQSENSILPSLTITFPCSRSSVNPGSHIFHTYAAFPFRWG